MDRLGGDKPNADNSVLMLAAANPSQQAYGFFCILLRNPNLSVNLQDYESGYTALHRALYAGNIRAARDLLARHDIDVSVKDSEGLTPFDLFNGTVDGTNPGAEETGTDLFTWGVNRNYALGTPDSSDKAFPDRINLLTQRQASDNPDPAQRFFNVGVKDIKMGKLHTAVVTTEARGNLSLCGFGSGGRLGRSLHSQLALVPLPDLPHTIVDIALGQDHTLALTSGGYILSWGNNRFGQLGYVIDAPETPNPFAKDGDELIQTSPKRIIGSLKKEWVRGVAAGRMSSACWTADGLYTWGTNLGHLGYEKAGTPVQMVPRRVTAITQPVIDVALSDYAMLVLLDSNEVLCFHHDTHFKINFSNPPKSLKAPKNPGQVTLDPNICKVTSCGQTFATLSKKGDVCTFTLPHPSEEATKDVRDRHVIVKPQVQWALRRNFTAVKDMALGSDGTMIVCTHSGHVFVRQRSKAGSGQLKFKRIPYLQRIIKVAANESGAFAAIRVDARPTPIQLKGNVLEEDMFLLQPHFRRFESQMTAEDFEQRIAPKHDEDDEEEAVNTVQRDTEVAVHMCQILGRWQASNNDSLFAWSESLLGSDITVNVGDFAIPAHSVILSLRSPALAKVLKGKALPGLRFENGALHMDVCHPLVAFLLLQYLYSDDVATVWDNRVATIINTRFKDLAIPVGNVKDDLRRIAEVLELSPLLPVLSLGSKSEITQRTLARDLASFFSQTFNPPSPKCDVVVALADREVAAQSVLLRARCPFFEAFFADQDWTLARREDGKVVIHMEHLRWRPMRLVFQFMHEGVEDDLFDYLHQETLDEFLDFVFEVLAAATELLMDRLVLVCSRVLARHCNPYNAAALATEASFYQANTLKRSVFDYIVSCMETMLESGLLDDMDEDVLRDLSSVIATKQEDKSFIPRSGILVSEPMAKHRDWLLLQDIPLPRVRAPQKWKPRSPVVQPMRSPQIAPRSPGATPDFKPLSSTNDEIFSMDEDQPSPPTPSTPARPGTSGRPMTPLTLPAGSSKAPVWKSRTVQQEKVDLRNIMAETAASRTPRSIPGTPAVRPGASPQFGPTPVRSGGSPWAAVQAPRTSLSSVQAQQSSPSSPGFAGPARASPSSSSLARPPATPATPRAAPKPASNSPSTSRLINPVKMSPSAAAASAQPRRSGNGPAWSTPSFAPVSPPTVSSATQGLSLLAIQQQEEQAAAERNLVRAPKSFAEIQAEEAAAQARVAAERAQEEEFARWWAQEQQRMGVQDSNANGGERGAGAGGRGRGRGQQRRVPRNRGKANGEKAAEVDPKDARIDGPQGGEGPSGSGRNAGGGGGRGKKGKRGGGGGSGAGSGAAPAPVNGEAAGPSGGGGGNRRPRKPREPKEKEAKS